MSKDDEFAEYMRARWRPMLSAAVLLGCGQPEAEDLVQVTFTRCYVKWDKVARADNRDAYVSRMLLNEFRASRRRRWWQERPTAEVPDAVVDDMATAHAESHAMDRALGRLSQPLREAVVLRYFTQLSERETAEVLGIAPGTVKSRLSRALAQLSADSHIIDLTNGRQP
ncbi:MAG: sigE [Marmoricola sp.]|nr:sigE [Marmoricola sp.]